MNLELSELITQRFKSARLNYFSTGLYAVFVVAVMFLASFILDRSGIYYWLLIATGIGAITILITILHYIKEEYPYGKIDWTIDRLRCTQGDTVAITLTNLGEDKLPLMTSETEPKVMWEAREEGKDTVASGKHGELKKAIEIAPGDSYTWLWPTEECCGVYRIYRLTHPREKNGTLVPLKRKIIIRKKPKKSKPKPISVKIVKA